ncbi:carbamate kinase [Mycolicibacterium sp. 050158]|uniref:amino acid kinase family protein n=1 Tax=Mycolicibacterium sp. 050158 TaxID=3090602 RepID=UPI00299DF5A3|nr:carbamate kinase [Mycolicibacterium sp. 050158]MDX1890752.1 carbamate kinase [Mycolicibacterium sp. 050158]
MRIVIALSGEALGDDGEAIEPGVQRSRLEFIGRTLAPLVAAHEVAICHGNRPEVGVLAAESATNLTLTEPYPLDALVAQTQGMIGYWLAQMLVNAGVDKPVLAVVTQTVVDASDPAFRRPTTFIGPARGSNRAHDLAIRHGWMIALDGLRWRRVVASPAPVRIVERDAIEKLLDDGVTVICAGGGGSAVTEDASGHLTGVEVVVDETDVAALLATAVHADRLLVLTDETGTGTGAPGGTPLPYLPGDDARVARVPDPRMRARIRACQRFVESTGAQAAIGALSEVDGLLSGSAGTTIAAHHP